MKKLIFALILTGCGGEPFASAMFHDGVTSDAGDVERAPQGVGGAPSSGGAESGGSGTGGHVVGIGGSGTGGVVTATGGTRSTGGALATGGTPSSGDAQATGGVSSSGGAPSTGGSNDAGPGTGGAQSVCCKFNLTSGPELRACDTVWYCTGAQTFSCKQQGYLCTPGLTCYAPGGPYGGVVESC